MSDREGPHGPRNPYRGVPRAGSALGDDTEGLNPESVKRYKKLQGGSARFTSALNPSPIGGSDPSTRKFQTLLYGRQDNEDGRPVSVAFHIVGTSAAPPADNTLGIPAFCARVYYGAVGGVDSYLEMDVLLGSVITVPSDFVRVDVALDEGIIADPDQAGGTYIVNVVIVDGEQPSAVRPTRTLKITPAGDSAQGVAVPRYAKRFRIVTTTPSVPITIGQFNANAINQMVWILGANQLCPWIDLVNSCRQIVVSDGSVAPPEPTEIVGSVIFELMI